MTYKRAIAIGLLASLGIALLVFGIKTGTFKRQNIGKVTTPISYNLNKKRSKTPLQVNADDYMPISTHWLLNEDQTSRIQKDFESTINFTTGDNQSYTKFKYYYSSTGDAYNWYYIGGNQAGSTKVFCSLGGSGTSLGWVNTTKRILNFETTPTGELVNMLNEIGQPIYNNNVILYDTHTVNSSGNPVTYNSCISQLRKNNVIIDNGSIINTNGTITLYIDQGISTLKINGTSYNNFNQTISITNNDIAIETTGTPIGIVGYTFTINYFNNLPVVEPTPLPDASANRIEYLDITGLMFQILTMPFTFISQAFNLTLWEGTPYQFNFSNFILSLISIATIIFIIKLFTSGFSVVGNYTRHSADTKLKNSQTKLNKAKNKEIESKTPKKE